MGANRRRLVNQSRVAYATAPNLRHGPRRWMISALNRPLIVLAKRCHIYPSPPTEASIRASTSRSVSCMEGYCDPRSE